MTVYDYRSDCGKSFEYECPMGEAPSEITVDSIVFRRDYGTIQRPGKVDKGFVSFSQPLKGSRWDTGPAAPEYDNEGRPYFPSRYAAKEYAKKTETLEGSVVYDD